MQAVVVVDVAQQAVAFLSGKLEDVHRGKLHTHEEREQGRVFGREVVGVERLPVGETAVEHIEVATLSKISQVGMESQKARQAKQEDNMEIGKTALARVEPFHGAYQIFKEQFAVVLFVERVLEKLRDEHGDGRLVGVDGNVGSLLPYAHRLEACQRSAVVVPFRLKNRKRLQKTGLDHCPLGARELYDERHLTQFLRECIYNHSVLSIFQNVEHHASGFDKHLLGKKLVAPLTKGKAKLQKMPEKRPGGRKK